MPFQLTVLAQICFSLWPSYKNTLRCLEEGNNVSIVAFPTAGTVLFSMLYNYLYFTLSEVGNISKITISHFWQPSIEVWSTVLWDLKGASRYAAAPWLVNRSSLPCDNKKLMSTTMMLIHTFSVAMCYCMLGISYREWYWFCLCS